ncbi:MAG TPA: SMC-Scp complex subunit ScpB [Bacillota bacterium]|nr:SMC-Scp complex subunit ScpB [Bacillota bacterium]
MSRKEVIKSAFESMMFVWGEPMDVKTAADIFNIDWKEAYHMFKELQSEYETQNRGIRIREIDKSFQFCTFEENDEYIQRLCTPVKEKRLTQSAMEVLAIIAYKQPVTKGEIESIRGIKCDRVIEGLLKKELIEEAGRSTGIGRPILYGTTKVFLKNFGFTNLTDLPQLEDISDVVRDAEEGEENDPLQITLDLKSGNRI